jgi:hypothetical protein
MKQNTILILILAFLAGFFLNSICKPSNLVEGNFLGTLERWADAAPGHPNN